MTLPEKDLTALGPNKIAKIEDPAKKQYSQKKKSILKSYRKFYLA